METHRKLRKPEAAVISGLFITLGGCGLIEIGGFPVLNDPAPDGSPVAQGNFQTVNESFYEDKSVSGIAIIYHIGGETYVVRTEALSAPSETDLQIVATAGGQAILQTTLRSPYGDQNYTVSVSGNPAWSTVRIRTPRFTQPALADYGVATLGPAP